MKMDRDELQKDLDGVNEHLAYLRLNQNENFRIFIPKYLRPTIWKEKSLHMNDAQGVNMYLLKIKAVLERALDQGWISRDELPAYAPEYLEERVLY